MLVSFVNVSIEAWGLYASGPKLYRDSAVELRIKLVLVWPRALYYSKLAFCKSKGVCESMSDVKKFAVSLIEIKHLAPMRHWKTVHWEITLHPHQASFAIGIPLFSHLEALQWLLPWPKAFFLCLLLGYLSFILSHFVSLPTSNCEHRPSLGQCSIPSMCRWHYIP